MTEFCYYHPSKEAVAKCSKCNKFICIDDSQQVTQIRNIHMGQSKGVVKRELYRQSASLHIYCIPCNTKRIIKSEKNNKIVKSCFLFMFFFSLISFVLSFIIYPGSSFMNFEDFNTFGPILEKILTIFGGMFGISLIIFFLIFSIIIHFNTKKLKILKERALQNQENFEKNHIQ